VLVLVYSGSHHHAGWIGHIFSALSRECVVSTDARTRTLLHAGRHHATTARAIAGLVRPAAGSIHFLGQSIVGIQPHLLIRRGLSLVPEGRGLFPYMSVEENLLIGGYSLTSHERRKALMERSYDLFPILKQRRRHQCRWQWDRRQLE